MTMPKLGDCAHCGRPFSRPPDAPHKRFCSDAHREAWHKARREKDLAEVRRLRREDPGALPPSLLRHDGKE